MGTTRMKQDRDAEDDDTKRRVNMEKQTEGTKQESNPYGLAISWSTVDLRKLIYRVDLDLPSTSTKQWRHSEINVTPYTCSFSLV